MRVPLVLLCAGLARAQAAPSGYVVRAEADAVWLDLTAADGARAGRLFTVFEEGAELTHPVTGASLGRVEKTVGSGRIREVAEKHSVGRLETDPAAVKAGQRARLAAEEPAPPPPAPEAAAPRAAGPPAKRAPRSRGAPLPYAANAMAAGRFDGGALQIALASDASLRLYAYPAARAEPLAEETLPGTSVKILGLEAADTDGDGRDELFVSLYDDAFRRFETKVFLLEGGRLRAGPVLPFLTRTLDEPGGRRVLAAQAVIDDRTFPYGSIYPLERRDGALAPSAKALRVRRADWLYGFTRARLPGSGEAALLLGGVHSLRVQLGKAHWRSPDGDYGQTPVRVRWHERLLEFPPPFAVETGPEGDLSALFAVRNIPALGGLATPFGMFNRAELQRLRWNGLAFETEWTADLAGSGLGLALARPDGRPELAVAVRGAADQTSVWVFDP